MNKFAKDGASLVPIAVPPIYKYSLLSKRKLLVVRTNSNSLQRDELVGFLVGDLWLKRYDAVALMPSLFGMLV